MRIALGIFIILHGLVHGILAVAPDPDVPEPSPGAFFTSPNRSWLLSKLGTESGTIQWIGLALVAVSTIGFVMSGAGVLGAVGLSAIWRSAVIAAAIVSLLLLTLFWHKWLPVGVAINILVLFALLVLHWPPEELFGA